MNCRNGAEYIQEALNSLIAQTFRDWELVAWDDGSTDGTLAILQSYADSRFRVISSSKGKSLASVRRAAVAECQGDWIAFLDQDDIWLPQKLELQMSKADNHPSAVMIYGRALRFGPNQKLKDYDHRHAWAELPEGNIFVRLFEDSCYICMSTVVLRAESVQALPAYPEAIQLTPDYYLYLTLCRNGLVSAVQEPVCLYRWHADNVSRQKGERVHGECVFLVQNFATDIDSTLMKRRLGVHQTLIAFAQMSSMTTFPQGVVRLFRFGSPLYLASRPFVRLSRSLKHLIERPYWQRQVALPLPVQTASLASSASSLQRGVEAHSGVPKRFPVLGSDVSVSSFQGAIAYLSKLVADAKGGFVSNANVYSVMLAREHTALRKSLSDSAYLSADGMPIVWMLKALGQGAERVHGDDLLFACCEQFPAWRHFFVGGREGQAEQITSALALRFPGICIVGARSTPVRPLPQEHTASILREVNTSGATMVWVGMGTPEQDLWMAAVGGQVKAPMAGVGSAFDTISGHSSPAPSWMKRSGLQWLFRLVQEPRRLLFRYLYYNTRFLFLAFFTMCRLFINNPPSSKPHSSPGGGKPLRMDLSVIIVTYNSASFIMPCLDAVRVSTAGLAIEIFVVDSGSTDEGPDLVASQYPDVTLTRFRNIGFSAANNMALPLCTGTHVVLLNPDTVVSAASLKLLIEALEDDSSIGAVGPSLLFPDGTVQDHSAHNLPRVWSMVTWLFLLDKLEWMIRFASKRVDQRVPPKGTWLDDFALLRWTRDQATYIPYLSGACLMIRGVVVEQVGLLDDASPLYLDDIDYCKRIQNLGWKLLYLPQSQVTHFWQQSSLSVQRDAEFYALLCHSIWIYLGKHHGRVAAACYCLAAFLAAVVRLLSSSLGKVLLGGNQLRECVRQQQMARALLTWSLGMPKKPPSLLFAPAPIPPPWNTAGRRRNA